MNSFIKPLSQRDLNTEDSSKLLQGWSESCQSQVYWQQKFEKEIAIGKSSTDPIDPWHKYLEWSKTQIENGYLKEYQKLLDKYLAEFLNHKQYKNDPRYVNFWLDKAQSSESPDEIYAFMRSNNIGIKCASFYVAWADKFEKEKNFSTARSLYDLAIRQHAEPRGTIAILKSAFESRVPQKSTENFSQARSAELDSKAPYVKPSQSTVDNMLVAEETFPFVESSAHQKIRELYGDSLENVRVMYPMNKYYSPAGEFQLEEILAAKRRRQTGVQKQEDSVQTNLSHFDTLKREKEKAEENLAKKRNQLARVLEILNSKMGLEHDATDQTINVRNLCQKFQSLSGTKETFSAEETPSKETVTNKSAARFGFTPVACNLKREHAADHESSSRHLSDLAQPSPTLCTKEAYGAVMTMFNEPLGTALPSSTNQSAIRFGKDKDYQDLFSQRSSTDQRSLLFDKSSEKQNDDDYMKLFSENANFQIFCDDQTQQKTFEAEKEKLDLFLPENPSEQFQIFEENHSMRNQPVDKVFDENTNTSKLQTENQPINIFDEKASTRKSAFENQPINVFDENASIRKPAVENQPINVFDENASARKPTVANQPINIFDENASARKPTVANQPINIFDENASARKPAVESQPINIFDENASTRKPPVENQPINIFDENSTQLTAGKQPISVFYKDVKREKLLNSTSKQSLSETIVAGEDLATTSFAERDVLGVTFLESGLLAESTSHESLFKKNKPERNQEAEENVHLSPILEASNEVSTISHPNCESLYPAKSNLTSDTTVPSSVFVKFNADYTSGSTILPCNSTDDSAYYHQLNVVDDPWLEASQKHIDWRNFEALRFFQVTAPVIRKNSQLPFGGQSFEVEDVIGKGGFAKVYRITSKSGNSYAVKVEHPRCEWEIAVIEIAKKRLAGHPFANNLFIDIISTALFKDASIIMTEYIPYGTLLDLVNYTSSQLIKLSPLQYHELTLQLLSIVDALHSVGIIHGDIKPDNFLVCTDYKSVASSLKVTPQLRLIDFGRAIDMQSYPPNTAFMASCGTSAFVCTQMKLKLPWNYHIDYFGLAGTIYLLLCNQYMKVVQQPNGDWKPLNRLPRWTDAMWSGMISTLLNFPDVGDKHITGYQTSPLPILIIEVKEAIKRMET